MRTNERWRVKPRRASSLASAVRCTGTSMKTAPPAPASDSGEQVERVAVLGRDDRPDLRRAPAGATQREAVATGGEPGAASPARARKARKSGRAVDAAGAAIEIDDGLEASARPQRTTPLAPALAADRTAALPALEREPGDEADPRVDGGAGRGGVEHRRQAALAQR